jgi:hypothetical protein
MAISQRTDSHRNATAKAGYGSKDKLIGIEISDTTRDHTL